MKIRHWERRISRFGTNGRAALNKNQGVDGYIEWAKRSESEDLEAEKSECWING